MKKKISLLITLTLIIVTLTSGRGLANLSNNATTNHSSQNLSPKRQCIWNKGDTITLKITGNTRPVVHTAAEILSRDLKSVLDATLKIVNNDDQADINVDIASDSTIKPQGFELYVGKNGEIHIISSDNHGASYGLLEISRLLGVSPWEWWADAKPIALNSFNIPDNYKISTSPSVEYRGIFINDEDWGLMPWSYLTHEPSAKGVIGPKTTARIFELLLRLRANTYWPPMHECSMPFFMTDGNREVAKKYGIYIGGSHCEPMGCNIAGEWPKKGNGDYNYVTNSEFIKNFWAKRVNDTKDQEIIFTLGMRGVHDDPIHGADDAINRKHLLHKIINDQRNILTDILDRDINCIPQVFIPYKEVQEAYDAGLEVPDDVTLMWCDDNHGYIRHFPNNDEAFRKGGNGIYYHVSYWGRPHDYLWLGTFSPGLMYQQMNLAYEKNIRKIWILNVGDIKPAEYQIELFMDMAWDINAVKRHGIKQHLCSFYAREFGIEQAKDITNLMTEHFRLAFIRKPEFMGNTRCEEFETDYYSIVRDLPFSEEECRIRIASYDSLEKKAEAIEQIIYKNRRDAFFQLVKYPVAAASQMNAKMLYAQLARHGKAKWNDSHNAFDSIASLTKIYNHGIENNGKWNHMMDFQPRKQPVFDKVTETTSIEELIKEKETLAIHIGTELIGNSQPCEMLGYENKAAYLHGPVSMPVKLPADTEVTIEFGLLPVHPVNNKALTFEVFIDSTAISKIDYHTDSKGEEWKENVLRNRSIRTVKAKISGNHQHVLTINPLTPGIIVDQIRIFKE